MGILSFRFTPFKKSSKYAYGSKNWFWFFRFSILIILLLVILSIRDFFFRDLLTNREVTEYLPRNCNKRNLHNRELPTNYRRKIKIQKYLLLLTRKVIKYIILTLTSVVLTYSLNGIIFILFYVNEIITKID